MFRIRNTVFIATSDKISTPSSLIASMMTMMIWLCCTIILFLLPNVGVHSFSLSLIYGNTNIGPSAPYYMRNIPPFTSSASSLLKINNNLSLIHCSSSSSHSPSFRATTTFLCATGGGNKADDGSGSGDEEIDLADRDWRAFRARLVMGGNDDTGGNTDDNIGNTSNDDDGDDDNMAKEEDSDDFDGIGSIFSSTPVASESTSDDQQQQQQQQKMTPLEPSQWAYDSGHVIEQGAVILGGVERDNPGFGLRQQYFHKAVILVLSHEPDKFTRGILLNMPTDVRVGDDINPGVTWRIWFGGDVGGLDSDNVEIVCLHSIPRKGKEVDGRRGNDAVDAASVKVMGDIRWTTFQNAKHLVKSGDATVDEFWVFAGYAGWGPSQLKGELDRGSWYMCSTDPGTLLQELAKQAKYSDPRDAGIDTWEMLMGMIGRGSAADDSVGGFGDLMLKEWARGKLLSEETRGVGGKQTSTFREDTPNSSNTISDDDNLPLDVIFRRTVAAKAAEAARKEKKIVSAGTIVRASSDQRSPFLLENQEYHKSTVLILFDDDNISVGAVMNHPFAQAVEMEMMDRSDVGGDGDGQKSTTKLPLRYGGEYAVKGNDSVIWLHHSARLRAANIGLPVGEEVPDGIWKCTQEEVTAAIGSGLAKPSNFMVISGVSVWMKIDISTMISEGRSDDDLKQMSSSDRGGIQGEIERGNFEVVSPGQTQEIWHNLQRQKVLSEESIDSNVECSMNAWRAGGLDGPYIEGRNEPAEVPVGDRLLVHGTMVPVSKLADDAFHRWISAFLLGTSSSFIGES